MRCRRLCIKLMLAPPPKPTHAGKVADLADAADAGKQRVVRDAARAADAVEHSVVEAAAVLQGGAAGDTAGQLDDAVAAQQQGMGPGRGGGEPAAAAGAEALESEVLLPRGVTDAAVRQMACWVTR